MTHPERPSAERVSQDQLDNDLPGIPAGMYVLWCRDCGASYAFDLATCESYPDWHGELNDIGREHLVAKGNAKLDLDLPRDRAML